MNNKIIKDAVYRVLEDYRYRITFRNRMDDTTCNDSCKNIIPFIQASSTILKITQFYDTKCTMKVLDKYSLYPDLAKLVDDSEFVRSCVCIHEYKLDTIIALRIDHSFRGYSLPNRSSYLDFAIYCFAINKYDVSQEFLKKLISEGACSPYGESKNHEELFLTSFKLAYTVL